MKDYYWKHEDGNSGIVTAPNSHGANKMIKSIIEDTNADVDNNWKFTRVDSLIKL